MSEPLNERMGKLEHAIARLVEGYAHHGPKCRKVQAWVRWHDLDPGCDCGFETIILEIQGSLERTRGAIKECLEGMANLVDDGK